MTLTQLDRPLRVRLGTSRRHTRATARRTDLDICLEDITRGRCLFTTWIGGPDPTPESLINGGPCATLVDFAMAGAVQSTLERGVTYRIVRFTVEVLRADTPPRGLLEARGEADDVGSGMTAATGRVVDARGVVRAEAHMLVRRFPSTDLASQ
jgi:acyl-coenzyme A thioesterase PaaI-like protein